MHLTPLMPASTLSHTASELRNKLAENIVRSKSRIPLNDDESTTITKKSTLIFLYEYLLHIVE
jgi:hypothetical protein